MIFSLVHCEWDDWVIGECDKECGGGMRTNTRTERQGAQHGGEECPGPASIEESCNVQECPGKVNFTVYTSIRIINYASHYKART